MPAFQFLVLTRSSCDNKYFFFFVSQTCSFNRSEARKYLFGILDNMKIDIIAYLF